MMCQVVAYALVERIPWRHSFDHDEALILRNQPHDPGRELLSVAHLRAGHLDLSHLRCRLHLDRHVSRTTKGARSALPVGVLVARVMHDYHRTCELGTELVN